MTRTETTTPLDGDRSARTVAAREIDLVAAAVVTALALVAVFVPAVRELPLRPVLVLPFVLFVPGYVLLAALYPERIDGHERIDGAGSVEFLTRTVLSFGVSVALVILVAVGLFVAGLGLRTVPIALALAGLTLGLCALAVARRDAVRRRGDDAVSDVLTPTMYGWATRNRSVTEVSRLAMYGVAGVVLVGAVGYGFAAPADAGFTEFAVRAENAAGDPVADGYRTDLVQGEAVPYWVDVGNFEGATTEYTVVIQLERVVVEGDDVQVVETQRIDTFSGTLADGERLSERHEVVPGITGERLRLVYLLYVGDEPGAPTVDNAYRELHLWVDVAPAA